MVKSHFNSAIGARKHMASTFARLLLFLSSYFPLAFIFFILFVQERTWVAVAILAVGLVGLGGGALYFRWVRKFGAINVKVESLQRRDGEAMSYVVSYIIPFLSAPFSGWQQGVALAAFFLMLGVLYVNSSMIHINPMLNFVGYHLYEVVLDDGVTYSLIARKRVGRGQTLAVVKIGDEILIGKQ
jgi:hypothetical protein